jgi:hypothetical protein
MADDAVEAMGRSVPLVIVVGTGRCGSTMLTRILQMHSEVLSLGEFWSLFLSGGGIPTYAAYEGRIPTDEISGEEFWQRICKLDPYGDGFTPARSADPHPVASDGFDYETGIPPISRFLASLTNDPNALYDQLTPEIATWPNRGLLEHCRALFTKLAIVLGRRVIVERTGGSLYLLSTLRQEFPEARYVLLHRNGPDCALSMSRHFVFRLAAMRRLAIAASSASDFDGLISPPFDKQRFYEYPIPLSFFAGIWSEVTSSGVREIRRIPYDRWMTLRYETLLSEARTELARLTDFIGVDAREQWLDKSCEFIDAGRAGKALSQLHPIDLAALRSACLEGTKAFDLLESEHVTAAG